MLPTDPRILALNEQQLEFIEYSMICDDPKALEKLETTVVDDTFDDFVKEVENENLNLIDKEKQDKDKEIGAKQDEEDLQRFYAKVNGTEFVPKELPKQEEVKSIEVEDDYIVSTTEKAIVDDFEEIDLDSM